MTTYRSLLAAVLLMPLAAGCKAGGDGGQGTLVAAEPIVLEGLGFATPESMLHDPLQDLYFVSNINGAPTAEDDNGFISVLTADGEVVALKWIDGASDSVTLHAPKGMALSGPHLYVTDITTIRRFDRQTGAPMGEIPIPGATFLNDIAALDDGTLYVTDTGLRPGPDGFEPSGTDAVYRIFASGTIDTLAMGTTLGHPNGIALAGDTVWVVSWDGEIYRVAEGGKADVQRLPGAQLDGIVVAAGQVYVSGWEGQALYRGPVGGALRVLLTGLQAPADIGHDRWRHRLLVPHFTEDRVRIVPLTP